MGREEFNKKINYDRIKTAASHLFATNGYANTSMNDIAEILSIKKASLYHHIQTRETLLIDIIKDIEQTLQEACSTLKTFKEYNEQKKFFMTMIQHFYGDNSKAFLMLKLSYETAHDSIISSVNRFIDTWIKQFHCLLTHKTEAKLAKETAEHLTHRLLGTLIHSNLANKKLMMKKIIQDINRLLA